MYTLYKNTHRLEEPAIAALFAVGFLCAGVSATFTGSLADKLGRKRACLSYCVLSSLSCFLTVTSSNRSVLFFGRVLGGTSMTLLYTVFETWMISEYHRLRFGHSAAALSSMYGFMAIVNGFTAAGSGLMAQMLSTVSECTPFLASVVCLGLAATIMSKTWVSNSIDISYQNRSYSQPRRPGRKLWQLPPHLAHVLGHSKVYSTR